MRTGLWEWTQSMRIFVSHINTTLQNTYPKKGTKQPSTQNTNQPKSCGFCHCHLSAGIMDKVAMLARTEGMHGPNSMGSFSPRLM